jgi:type 1 fimbriae regulatory protein FimB
VSNITRKSAAFQVVPKAGSQPPRSDPPKHRRHTEEPPYLRFEEVARLFAVIESPRDRAIFRLAYHAGLRASEVGRLELRDYNQHTERIFVHRLKGSNSGEHHLVREESKALRAWLKIRGAVPGAIFLSNRRTPIQRRMLDVLMKKYGALAAISPKLCHFHVLKHTCVTHLSSRGFRVEQVQDRVRHANIQNTMKYLHITNAGRDQMAEQLRDTWR